MSILVKITKEMLYKTTTGTLPYYILEATKNWKKEHPEEEIPKKIQLSFEESTYQAKLENGGAEDIIIPEFTIPCLLKDFLKLMEIYEIEIIENFSE